jgi:arylsulfatase A-like enzyme
MAEAHPHFILIMADQLRSDAVGMDGNRLVQTPNIDSLAARGTRFNHAYSACPSCIPARATLWTGMNQWHTGILGMGRGQGPMPDDFPHTLPGELVKAGYFAQLIGKGHFHPQRATMGFSATELDESGRVESEGFICDYRRWWLDHAPPEITPDDHGIGWNAWQARPWHAAEHLHPTAWTMGRALEFLRTRPKDQPFFLNISFARPHSPYVPPQAYWDMYANAPTPPAQIGNWTHIHDRPGEIIEPDAWRAMLSPEQIHRARAGYYGEISFIDAQLGRLFNWMQRFDADAYRNTCFIFLSDHGDMLGDHHLLRKTYGYEGSARVPLVIRPPAGRRPDRPLAEEVVELRDIMPTILEMAGVPCPPTVDGRSLLPLLNAPAPDWRAYLHGEHSTCYADVQEMHYVTDGRRKFIWLPRIGREQYFHLEADPGECFDRIDDPACQSEITVWRHRLTAELAARNCGWTQNGRPFCPNDDPLISPYITRRYTGRDPA